MANVAVHLDDWIKRDRQGFNRKEHLISDALVNFTTGMLNKVDESTRRDVFYMLVFCLLVPQSRQSEAEKVCDKLRTLKYYEEDIPIKQLSEILRGKVRFHNRKSEYIWKSREKFYRTDFWKILKQKSEEYHKSEKDVRYRVLLRARTWLIGEINGMSFKLASHFLRNIGMRGLAILDVHILRSMQERGLIENYSPLTRDKYYNIEKKLQDYAKALEVGIDELDQLFWSNATGYVGK
jgi:N-glycosylase/DNA lyase